MFISPFRLFFFMPVRLLAPSQKMFTRPHRPTTSDLRTLPSRGCADGAIRSNIVTPAEQDNDHLIADKYMRTFL